MHLLSQWIHNLNNFEWINFLFLLPFTKFQRLVNHNNHHNHNNNDGNDRYQIVLLFTGHSVTRFQIELFCYWKKICVWKLCTWDTCVSFRDDNPCRNVYICSGCKHNNIAPNNKPLLLREPIFLFGFTVNVRYSVYTTHSMKSILNDTQQPPYEYTDTHSNVHTSTGIYPCIRRTIFPFLSLRHTNSF